MQHGVNMKVGTQSNGAEYRDEINPHIYGQLVFDNGQGHSVGKGQSPQQIVLGKMDNYMHKTEIKPIIYTKTQATKAKFNKQDYIKPKCLCTANKKKNQQNEKATYRMGENF